uniref:U8-Hexatoxin-Hf1a_1 n=1 Tax=Hadronyche formidabilis TaxID=426499 RepID=A0A4Q8K4N4_HADFO
MNKATVLVLVCMLAIIHHSTGKHGCPPPDNKVCFQYYDQCTSNADCSAGQLCCLQPGCGHECK